MLDDDVDWICSRAEALVWKLIHSPKHKVNNDFHRQIKDLEKSLEYARIVDACVRDAIKEFKKKN